MKEAGLYDAGVAGPREEGLRVTMTLAVKNLPRRSDQYRHRQGLLFIAGRLWLDSGGARLYDWDGDGSVPLCDSEACTAMRAVLPPPGEYLGGALLQVFVREGAIGPELYGAYWVRFFELDDSGVHQWGACVGVRPVPPEHDYIR